MLSARKAILSCWKLSDSDDALPPTLAPDNCRRLCRRVSSLPLLCLLMCVMGRYICISRPFSLVTEVVPGTTERHEPDRDRPAPAVQIHLRRC